MTVRIEKKSVFTMSMEITLKMQVCTMSVGIELNSGG